MTIINGLIIFICGLRIGYLIYKWRVLKDYEKEFGKDIETDNLDFIYF